MIELENIPNLKEQMNKYALEVTNRYLNLKVANSYVRTPFYSNEIGAWINLALKESGFEPDDIESFFQHFSNPKIVPYGWFKGKGKPQEISEAAERIADSWGLSLDSASPESIIEFMKYAGLGIDCSGFVYNVLEFAFEQIGRKEEFINSLAWSDPQYKNVYRAGVFVFSKWASNLIKFSEIENLDLILVKNDSENYSHIGLVLGQDNYLVVAHSVIGQIPTGVHTSSLEIVESPKFGFVPNLTKRWEDLYSEGKIEFRRLKILWKE